MTTRASQTEDLARAELPTSIHTACKGLAQRAPLHSKTIGRRVGS